MSRDYDGLYAAIGRVTQGGAALETAVMAALVALIESPRAAFLLSGLSWSQLEQRMRWALQTDHGFDSEVTSYIPDELVQTKALMKKRNRVAHGHAVAQDGTDEVVFLMTNIGKPEFTGESFTPEGLADLRTEMTKQSGRWNAVAYNFMISRGRFAPHWTELLTLGDFGTLELARTVIQPLQLTGV